MEINLTDIIVALINLLIPVVLALFLKPMADKQKQAQWLEQIQVVAQAAEQLYKTGSIQSRKQYVLKQLERKGIKIDGVSLDAAIEAAVHNINAEQGGHHEVGTEAEQLPAGPIPDRLFDGRTGEALR